MSWVGLRDQAGGVFSVAGLGKPSQTAFDMNGLMPRGTLMVEFASDPSGDRQIVLDYTASHPWPAGLRLCLDADGVLRLTQWQGDTETCFALSTGLLARATSVTVTYTWDAPARRAVLSAEIEDRGRTLFMQGTAPLPLSLRDGMRIMADKAQSRLAPGVRFAALADTIMPIGPLPTLAPETLIDTPQGAVPIQDLRAGQIVTTADGDLAQVRWAGGMSLPARGRFAPLNMRAPFHGVTRDIQLAHDQRLRFAGSEVEYLFGTETVAVNAGHLRDGMTVLPMPRALTADYCQILLDRPATLNLSGLIAEGLDPQPLLKDPALRSLSLLRDMPGELLPKGNLSRVPVLLGFEALTLSALRAA